MATNSIYIAVASILKVFDISHARDKSGKEIPIEFSYSTSSVMCVLAPSLSHVVIVLNHLFLDTRNASNAPFNCDLQVQRVFWMCM